MADPQWGTEGQRPLGKVKAIIAKGVVTTHRDLADTSLLQGSEHADHVVERSGVPMLRREAVVNSHHGLPRETGDALGPAQMPA
nr:hypothetical protein [Synechococcus sp. CS-1332]